MEAIAQELPAIQRLLTPAQKIKIITHVYPDGDAIGSLTALGNGLRQLGKEVELACDHPSPDHLAFLPLADEIVAKGGGARRADLIVAVDCGDAERMGRSYSAMNEPLPPIINIDHHRTNTYFGAANLVVPTATSAAEIIYRLLPALGGKITEPIAISLLAGIVTDTLAFRTSNVTADALQIAGELIAAGANLHQITEQALIIKPLTIIKLYQIGLNNMRFEDGFLWTTINLKEQKSIGFVPASGVGLVSMLGNVKEAAMGCALMELEGDRVTVSLRSRVPWDVSTLATELGGGGHQQAAGCNLRLPLHEAERLMVARAKEEIARQKAHIK